MPGWWSTARSARAVSTRWTRGHWPTCGPTSTPSGTSRSRRFAMQPSTRRKPMVDQQQTPGLAVRQSVVVETSQERAFEVFTSRLADWWPLETHVRSEEHTSELQHTIISYAVFCLKKKVRSRGGRLGACAGRVAGLSAGLPLLPRRFAFSFHNTYHSNHGKEQTDFAFFFFNDTAPTEIYPFSLHDALPIYADAADEPARQHLGGVGGRRAEARRDHH